MMYEPCPIQCYNMKEECNRNLRNWKNCEFYKNALKEKEAIEQLKPLRSRKWRI